LVSFVQFLEMKYSKLSRKQFTGVVAVMLVLGLAIFYLVTDIDQVSLDFLYDRKPTIASQIACRSALVTTRLAEARKLSRENVRLLVHFEERPSVEVSDFLAEQGVIIYRHTWIFDYLVVDSPIDKLCYLTSLPSITKIDLAE
jgi:hypothetical protein